MNFLKTFAPGLASVPTISASEVPNPLAQILSDPEIKELATEVLPEPLKTMVNDLQSMRSEALELRDKLIDPIHGQLIPFCSSKMTFEPIRMTFCSQIVKDLVLIAAGGTGFATIVSTLTSAPDQIFALFTEAFIPALNELVTEGKTTFKTNMDAVLMKLININTNQMLDMQLDAFILHVETTLASSAAKLVGMNGGALDREQTITEIPIAHLKKLAREYGLSDKGTKQVLVKRLERTM